MSSFAESPKSTVSPVDAMVTYRSSSRPDDPSYPPIRRPLVSFDRPVGYLTKFYHEYFQMQLLFLWMK